MKNPLKLNNRSRTFLESIVKGQDTIRLAGSTVYDSFDGYSANISKALSVRGFVTRVREKHSLQFYITPLGEKALREDKEHRENMRVSQASDESYPLVVKS